MDDSLDDAMKHKKKLESNGEHIVRSTSFDIPFSAVDPIVVMRDVYNIVIYQIH